MRTQPTHDRPLPATAAPRGEGGPSLAEMAQRDLDAALQLLADRAQYITGASGAAIALRRAGKQDMLCRASAGSNAPELGALISTEFGLSGESVRTRQALRCDDAERDVRVNRDVCRQMGIASVVVMPVVNDDEVLGVFELFSGEANAFGVRDVSAVERLSEMVETAVRLARATENLPQRLKMNEVSAPEVVKEAEADRAEEDQILEGEVLGDLVLEEPEPGPVVAVTAAVTSEGAGEVATSRAEALADAESSVAALEALSHPKADTSGNREVAAAEALQSEATIESTVVERTGAAAPKAIVAENAVATPQVAAPQSDATPVAAPEAEAPKKKLLWSAAQNPAADAEKPEEPDQSHVPPVLRSLRKCEACGFPVSAGRVFCVECEEKKWRGHLKVPKVVAPLPTATHTSPVATVAPRPEGRAFAAAAQSAAVSAPVPSTQQASTVAAHGVAIPALPVARKESKEPTGRAMAAGPASAAPARVAAVVPAASKVQSREFVLSAGMKPSQSWFSANKYIIAALLVVGAVVAAVLLLR